MKTSVQAPLPPMRVTSVAPNAGGSNGQHGSAGQSSASVATAVAQALSLLRLAVSDCNYTLDALCLAMGKDPARARAHVHRVLNGEKAMTLEFLIGLPRDVKARFTELSAQHFGYVVVKPATAERAANDFVAGLLGLLSKKVA